MLALTDSMTIGIVLTLVFGAMFLYLYNRVAQLERRVDLTETLLLDLKTATGNTLMSLSNQQSYNLPRESNYNNVEEETLEPLSQKQNEEVNEVEVLEEISNEDFYKNVLSEAVSKVEDNLATETTKVNVNYESMSLKELKVLAKDRDVTIPSGAHKKDIISLLKNGNETENDNMNTMFTTSLAENNM